MIEHDAISPLDNNSESLNYIEAIGADAIQSFFEHWLSSRFGLMSKQEIELSLFRLYLLSLGDANDSTNLDIGSRLGITESKAANLKYKAHLQESSPRASFEDLMFRGTTEFGQRSGNVIIHIDDSYSRAYFKNELIKTYGYPAELSTISSRIKIPLERYLDILYKATNKRASIRDKLNEYARQNESVKEALGYMGIESTFIEVISGKSTREQFVVYLKDCASILLAIVNMAFAS